MKKYPTWFLPLLVLCVLPLVAYIFQLDTLPLHSLKDLLNGGIKIFCLVIILVALIWGLVILVETTKRLAFTEEIVSKQRVPFPGRLHLALAVVVSAGLCLLVGWLVLEGWELALGL